MYPKGFDCMVVSSVTATSALPKRGFFFERRYEVRSGRASGEGNGNPFRYFCLGNPMNGGAWQAMVRGVAKS